MGISFIGRKINNKLPGGVDGNLISIGSNEEFQDSGIPKSQLNQRRGIWGYQDFNAGVINSTNVTLTANSNGISAPFIPANITGTAFIVRSDDREEFAYTGATELFSSKVKVNSNTNDSVVLSGIPHSSYPIRIYYEILSNFYPENYQKPAKILSASALDKLNPIIATQEELDTKEPLFSKNNAFNKNFGTDLNTIPQGNDARFLVKRLRVLVGSSGGKKKGGAFNYGATISDPFFSTEIFSSNSNDAFICKIISRTSTTGYYEVYRADGGNWGDTNLQLEILIFNGTY